MTRRHVLCCVAAIAAGLATVTLAGQPPQRSATSRTAPSPLGLRTTVLRPPAVPLVAHDPYFSIWSTADRLTDTPTVHWTGRAHPMNSLIRIDGDAARLMGATPANIAALPQTSVTVRPTHTIYTFANARVKVTLTFMTPSLPSDLDVFSRPVTYITWNVESADGTAHQVQIYFDCGADIAVNTTDQSVQLDYPKVEGLAVARVGSTEQPVLARRGDDVRIDWGYGYLAVPTGGDAIGASGGSVAAGDSGGRLRGGGGAIVAGGSGGRLRGGFTSSGTIPHTGPAAGSAAGPVAGNSISPAPAGDSISPAPVSAGRHTMAAAWDLGNVGPQGATRYAMLA
jgi:hypothetical protein